MISEFPSVPSLNESDTGIPYPAQSSWASSDGQKSAIYVGKLASAFSLSPMARPNRDNGVVGQDTIMPRNKRKMSTASAATSSREPSPAPSSDLSSADEDEVFGSAQPDVGMSLDVPLGVAGPSKPPSARKPRSGANKSIPEPPTPPSANLRSRVIAESVAKKPVAKKRRVVATKPSAPATRSTSRRVSSAGGSAGVNAPVGRRRKSLAAAPANRR